ncbi:uncharacterized protein V1518DRAFT_415381 [Limtongia smithiae]|uniref:uncharacterized protein n=1 Tax=Limtongia smithiae TaxID=1125753 RepID=UPI0034CE146F
MINHRYGRLFKSDGTMMSTSSDEYADNTSNRAPDDRDSMARWAAASLVGDHLNNMQGHPVHDIDEQMLRDIGAEISIMDDPELNQSSALVNLNPSITRSAEDLFDRSDERGGKNTADRLLENGGQPEQESELVFEPDQEPALVLLTRSRFDDNLFSPPPLRSPSEPRRSPVRRDFPEYEDDEEDCRQLPSQYTLSSRIHSDDWSPFDSPLHSDDYEELAGQYLQSPDYGALPVTDEFMNAALRYRSLVSSQLEESMHRGTRLQPSKSMYPLAKDIFALSDLADTGSTSQFLPSVEHRMSENEVRSNVGSDVSVPAVGGDKPLTLPKPSTTGMRTASGRRVFSTLSENLPNSQQQQQQQQQVESVMDNGKNSVVVYDEEAAAQARAKTWAASTAYTFHEDSDDPPISATRKHPRSISSDSSSYASDDFKENLTAPSYRATKIKESPYYRLGRVRLSHAATTSGLRRRKIRPGGGGTSPVETTIKNAVARVPFGEIAVQRPPPSQSSVMFSRFRRASDRWRQRMMETSMEKILRPANRSAREVVNSSRGIVEHLPAFVWNNLDYVVGMACTIVVVGVVYVVVCSWMDDYGRDVIGLRTEIYECAKQTENYRATLQCLTSKRLPSVFSFLGVDTTWTTLHRYILIDLYLWSLIFLIVIAPAAVVFTGGSLIGLSIVLLLVVTASERGLRYLLRTTVRLMEKQLDEVKSMQGMVDGSDRTLFPRADRAVAVRRV